MFSTIRHKSTKNKTVDNVDNSVDNAFEVALFDKKRVKKRT